MTTPARPALHLAIVSAVVLFAELALIRWLPAHVMFLTFFTNTVLLAAFVGMCLGCLTASRPGRAILATPLWLAVTIGSGLLLQTFENILVSVGQQSNPDVVFFGTEQAAYEQRFALPVEVFMAVFFVLSALCLVGPGQEMGRAFNAVASRTKAYSANLLGSLAGIVLFAVISEFWLPPVVWFAILSLGVAYLLGRGVPKPGVMPYLFLLVLCVASVRTSGLVSFDEKDRETIWSPYYRIDFRPEHMLIYTNMMGHQQIEPREAPSFEPYVLPHMLRRDVKDKDGKTAWPPFKRVLIIGAGSGNDLSRACAWCPPDARIDAVEIDPVIQGLGKRKNPDKPYADPRINPVLNDGRNFLRKAPSGEYDLVIFALVDSLVLHSGYSSVRLENFLFTQESLKDVQRVLKPTGVAAIYNFFRMGFVVGRLRDQIATAFGNDPAVLVDPPTDNVAINDFQGSQFFTSFFCGSKDVLDPLKAAFAASENSYWAPGNRAITPEMPAYFQKAQPAPLPKAEKLMPSPMERPEWARLKLAVIAPSPADLTPSTDDWPFLYSRVPGVPGLTWRGGLIMLLLSVGMWWLLVKRHETPGAVISERGLMLRSFLLGAGFMLVETKAVVHMALLFGSTWKVNTFVFGAVLLMSLAGNLFAGWLKPKNLLPYFIGLFASLLMNVLVPLDAFLGMDQVTQIVASCALAFLPIAFAGVIFATSFAAARNPDRIFGANVAGALVGGLSENLSMLLGFRYLLLVALAYYIASSLMKVEKAESKANAAA